MIGPTLPVQWEDGLFLLPHHFQQEARAHRSALGAVRLSLCEDLPAWLQLEMDWTGLPWGRVRLGSAVMVGQDGLCLQWPEQVEDPGVFSLPMPTHETAAVWLGIMVDETTHATQWAEIRDEGNRLEPIQMALLQRRSRWVLGTSPAELGQAVAVARLCPEGSIWRLDPEFCPPMLRLQGAPMLRQKLRMLLDRVAASLEQLGRRFSADRATRSASALTDLPDRLWASVLASFHARCTTLLHSPASTPRQCADLLQETCAEWAAARGRPCLHSFGAWHPTDSMSGIAERISACLSMLGTTESQGIRVYSFGSDEHGLRQARVDPGCLQSGWDAYLAVQSEAADLSWIASVPRRLKLGAWSDLRARLHNALPGIPLSPVTSTPVQLSVRQGRHYFALDRRSPLFDAVADTGSISLYCPSDMTRLDIELVFLPPEGM